MILTCPECATSYFVEDAAIGEGRTVRCTSCSASWRAYVEAPRKVDDGPDAPTYAVETAALDAPDAPAPPPTPTPTLIADDEDLFEAPLADHPAEELPKVFRARAETGRRMREAAVQGAIWAGMGAVLALFITTALVFRIDIVRLWPRTASAYAGIGLPVNVVGLTVEDLKARPGLQDGRAVLVVSGLLRNVRAKPVVAPPLSITLLDKDGKRLVSSSATVSDPLVPAGQARSFAVTLLDPPGAASDLDLTFVLGRPHAQPRPVAAATVHPAAPPVLRSAPLQPQAVTPPPPVENATPLPATSPYALQGDSAAH